MRKEMEKNQRMKMIFKIENICVQELSFTGSFNTFC